MIAAWVAASTTVGCLACLGCLAAVATWNWAREAVSPRPLSSCRGLPWPGTLEWEALAELDRDYPACMALPNPTE